MRRRWADVLAELSECQPNDVVGGRDVLVIAPHPDDESLGCGGLLCWAARHGRNPRVLFLTDGEGSHPGSPTFPPERLSKIRHQEARRACAALGLKPNALTFLRCADSGMGSLTSQAKAELVDAIAGWVKHSARSAVFVTADTDPHCDHAAAFQLTRRAVRGCAGASLFAYPVWTWLRPEDAPEKPITGMRMNIAPFVDAKRAAIACHASQFGNLITDSDQPFALPQPLLDRMTQDFEVALDVQL